MSDRAVLDLKLRTLAQVHLFYVKGFENSVILSEEQVREGYSFIENVEKILIGTGYMGEREIKSRHKRKVEAVNSGTIIPYPFV